MLDYARRHWLPEPIFSQPIGKGFYGTAYATTDPKKVVKMTSDNDEGLLMAAQLQHSFAGIVPCYGCLHVIRDKWLIWKEALDLVGYPAWFAKFGDEIAGDPIDEWLDVARMIEDGDPGLGMSVEDALYGLAEKWPPLRDICETCVYLHDAYGMIPGDMHANNFGCWNNLDQMILFDAQMGDFAEHVDYESCENVEDDLDD